ncbi:hypothetical protein [uncultured Erythrobacter sp.]|uniref:hypothetical protein n=1 Tax=uncultured Erythrobacter sp. TaxID=263913 RepID=UPI00261AD5D0|nr:hypothetical protein [uncultured Erythrobacter sp.]
MSRLAKSRFNPAPGIVDFWTEFRKPNPYRWPILIASTAPFALIMVWLTGEKHYGTPEKPQITYVTTYDPDRSDAEIMASNIENQEVKELREAQDAELAQRKRDLYKALGAVAGMDVDEIERRADETRAAEEAAEQARLDEMFGRAPAGENTASGEASSTPDTASESSAP